MIRGGFFCETMQNIIPTTMIMRFYKKLDFFVFKIVCTKYRLVIKTIAFSVLLISQAVAQLPAFPGAEGEGMFTSGGRGGDVYHVTNLNDSGVGSFRHAVDSASGPRTVVFDVSGSIPLESTLDLRRSNITIAGETAPGKGISVINYGIIIRGSNIIMRHIRARPGDAAKGAASEGGFFGDAIQIKDSDVILDHISTSWGIDETLSVSGEGTKRVTVQYSTISEGLDQTGLFHDEWDPKYNPGGEGHHSNGTLIYPSDTSAAVTFHHNLWSNNYNRNPSVSASDNPTVSHKVEITNNVLYNYRTGGYTSGDSDKIRMNYVGNIIIVGPSAACSLCAVYETNVDNDVRIYQDGNKWDFNRNGIIDGIVDQPGIIIGAYTNKTSPVSMAPVTVDSADDSFAKVMMGAGALPWNRDEVDARLITEVMTYQGKIIDSQEEVGGYPTLPEIVRPADWDIDADGMPNWWEDWIDGLNPLVADNNGDLNNNGYTNLEDFLHFQASGARIPEPTSLFLIATSGLLASMRRRVLFTSLAN